jgi:hypothetical protein
MAPKKRSAQTTTFDAPPVLSTKRKRATISYAEVEADSTSDNENLTPVEENTTIDTNEDDAFSTGRKVRRLPRDSITPASLTHFTEEDYESTAKEKDQESFEEAGAEALPLPGSATGASRHDL